MSLTTLGNYRSIPSKEYTEISTQEAKETYRISLKQGEDGWLIVTSPDLKPLVTQGKSEKEAISNAYEAAHLLQEEAGIMKDFNLVIIE
jgi:predicted RNase H-like HicB family nuclease